MFEEWVNQASLNGRGKKRGTGSAPLDEPKASRTIILHYSHKLPEQRECA